MGTLATLAGPSDADSTPILYCWPHGLHLAAEVSVLEQNANERGVGAGVSFHSFRSFSLEGVGGWSGSALRRQRALHEAVISFGAFFPRARSASARKLEGR